MKNLNFLSESEKNNILNLYIEKKIIVEQQAQVQQNYTIQDLQNILNRAPYNSKLTADNKFGPLTAGAISSALDMVKSGQASNYFQPMQSKQVTSIPTSTTTQQAAGATTQQAAGATTQQAAGATTQQAAGATTQQAAGATTQQAAGATTAQPAPPLKTSQTSLITPKTVKSQWCIQNTKREDEDCFSGSSSDYQTARSEANRVARANNRPYKRVETKMGENPYYAIYATQTLDSYEEKKTQQQNQKTSTT